MTTITVKNGLKNLTKHSFEDYQDLMDELAEFHGYKILWQLADEDIPNDVMKSLKKYEDNPDQELFNL